MQLTGRVSVIIVAAALILAEAICLLVMRRQNPVLLASSHGYTQFPPGEPFCLQPSNHGIFLTRFWGEVVNKTGVDDSSAVLLDFQLSGYPGKIPRFLYFSFSSKKDWWNGSRRIALMGNGSDNCGCYSIMPSRESLDISGEMVSPPGKLFSELEQVSFSDLGVGGKELFINTALGYGPMADSSEKRFLLANGSVVPLHGITFDPQTSVVYPWSIQIMECTGEPNERGCSSRPGVWVFSDQRLKGAAYSTKV